MDEGANGFASGIAALADLAGAALVISRRVVVAGRRAVIGKILNGRLRVHL